MEFKINKFENENLGEMILIKKISKSDFSNIIKALINFGFKRNLNAEKEIKSLLIKRPELSNSDETILKIYKNKNGEAEVEYKTKLNICSIRLKSNIITAKELINLIAENQ